MRIPGLSRARLRAGAERMSVLESGGVDHKRLRGRGGIKFGTAPRRRIDGGKSWRCSTLTHRFRDTRAGGVVYTHNYSYIRLLCLSCWPGYARRMYVFAICRGPRFLGPLQKHPIPASIYRRAIAPDRPKGAIFQPCLQVIIRLFDGERGVIYFRGG